MLRKQEKSCLKERICIIIISVGQSNKSTHLFFPCLPVATGDSGSRGAACIHQPMNLHFLLYFSKAGNNNQ